MSRMIDLIPCPAIIIDEGGGILDMNDQAEAIIAECDAMNIASKRRGRLSFGKAGDGERVTRALQSVLDSRIDTAVSNLTMGDGRPLGVICSSLAGESLAAWPSARVLVSFADPQTRVRKAHGILQRCFGLTASEARIASLVGGGMGNPQIATHLGLSRETIKRHLSGIFAKTGVKTQAGLAVMVSSMPRC